MSLAFDHSGLIVIDDISTWQSVGGDFDIIMDMSIPPADDVDQTGLLEGDTATGGRDWLVLRDDEWQIRVNGGYDYPDTATIPYGSRAEINLRCRPDAGATSGFLWQILIDGQPGTEYDTDDIDKYSVQKLASAEGRRAEVGFIFHRVQLIDNDDPSNTRDYRFDDGSGTTVTDYGPGDHHGTLVNFADAEAAWVSDGAVPTLRKSSTFDVETTLSGTVTDATLDGNAITVDSQDGTTVTLTESDGSITTSGEYDLVLTDDSADPDETITVQVDVYGVVPSDNPFQKDGSALADLTDVQYRVVAGTDLNGTELFYTGTGATDASGNIPTFDVSDSAADVDDTVHIVGLTANGESIVATETVELI